MDELNDILNEIGKSTEPSRPRPDLAIAPRWTEADKQKSFSLQLSKYELYWLMWRIEVHLRSYEDTEWSEMKDVMMGLLKELKEIWDGPKQR
jgi:hypothetical protein